MLSYTRHQCDEAPNGESLTILEPTDKVPIRESLGLGSASLFSLNSIIGHLWERAGLLVFFYLKFSCVLPLSHMASWVRCGTCLY